MSAASRIALVTGASRGIGRAIALRLAARGDRIAVHYRANRGAAEATLADLPGGPHLAFAVDVADARACYQLVDDVIAQMGGLQVLVNNAGIYEDHPLLSTPFEQWQAAWQATLATNLLGPANLMYAAARHMAAHGGGAIVNVSSRGAFRGEPDGPAYGASKAGLNSLSQSLARHLAPHGVLVGVVAPGFVETDMGAPFLEGESGREIKSQSPMNRVARPDEVARAVEFLTGEGIAFLTGCIIDVNGASYLRT